MWEQARNNSETVRATPAAPNITCVITRSQIAMTTTDINSSAQQCGPRGAHVDTPTNVVHVVRT